MTKHIQQHYIPRVYLKNFQIDDKNNKSFVWCVDFSNKYSIEPKKLGLNDKVFKMKKFYNDIRLQNPFAIEEILGSEFETKFVKIIGAVKKECKLSKETVKNLMIWLYISKMRSPYFRANTERLIKWFIETTNKYKNLSLSEKEKEQIDKYIQQSSKDIHLNYLIDHDNSKKLAKLFKETLNAKHWRILKSKKELPFCTNDNPGFSPNLHPMFAKDTPFHKVMEMNSQSMIFYVLSPNYCLEITPFVKGTSLTKCALNMEIEYHEAPLELVEFINKGVFYSKYKLIISNSKRLLDNRIKTEKIEK